MESEFRLTMTQESFYAHGVRIQNLHQGTSLYPITKLTELMPYYLLTREV